MAHKRLGIDIDGVLANFVDPFCDFYARTVGRDLFPPRPYEPPCWEFPRHCGYTLDEDRKAWTAVAADEYFWERLLMYPSAGWPYQRLMEWSILGAHDVYFMTNRKGLHVKQQTERWLRCRYNGRAVPTVLITDNKPYAAIALHLDALIDDYHQNTQEMALAVPTCHTYLLNRSWNAQEHAGIDVVRVDTLEEMFRREAL